MDRTINFIKQLNILKLIKDKKNPYFKYLSRGNQGNVYLFSYLDYENVVVKISDVAKRSIKEDLIMKELNKYNNYNFLKLYDSTIVNNKLILIMEYADYTLKKWLEESHENHEWISFILQYLTAVQFMQDKLKACHNDLHFDNILIKTTLQNDLEIEIDNNILKIQLYGSIFKISDFGCSESKIIDPKYNKLNKQSIDICIKNNHDVEELNILVKRIIMTNVISYYKSADLIKIIEDHNDTKFKKYLENSKKDIEKRLKELPSHAKRTSLLKSIAYYAIENKYIDYEDIPKKSQVLKIPGKDIIKLIEELCKYLKNHTINDAINKYFKSYFE